MSKKDTFEEWFDELNKYALDLGCINLEIEADEMIRELYDDDETVVSAFNELMRPD